MVHSALLTSSAVLTIFAENTLAEMMMRIAPISKTTEWLSVAWFAKRAAEVVHGHWVV